MAPGPEKYPSGHLRGRWAVESQNDPAGHRVQFSDPAVEKYPIGQGEHMFEPAFAIVPAAHGIGATSPGMGQMPPAAQLLQCVCPVSFW